MSGTEGESRQTTAMVGSLASLADVDPWDYFDRLREMGGIVWDETLEAWLVTRHELLRELARRDDIEFRISDPNQTTSQFGMSPEEFDYFAGFGSKKELSLTVNEEHDRAHGWWMALFGPSALASIRERVLVPNAHAQVDRFIDRHRAELLGEYASQVPPRNMAAVLGLPYEDDDWLARMQAADHARREVRQRFSEPNVGRDVIEHALAVTKEMYDLLQPHVAERRAGTGDDIISGIWRDASILFGDEVNENDVIGTTAHMWEAGNGTSGSATANALYWLMKKPELQNKVQSGGDKAVMRIVEESLRLTGPVTFRPTRFAVLDSDVGGTRINKGDRVIGVIGAANRDPRKYECPFDIDLERRAPRDHFAFWSGRRICAGQGLGRATVEANVAVLLDRVRDLRLDPDAEPPRYRGHMLRVWGPLHASFEPA